MKRGEVWRIDLDPTIDSEQQKTRPCVIVNHDKVGILPLKIIVPLTAWKDKFSQARWLVPIEASKENGLRKKSAADTFQVRSLSEIRFVEKIGTLTEGEIKDVEQGLIHSLDLAI